MEISTRKVNDVTVFDLVGDMVMGKSAQALHTRLREELESGARRFAVNLQRVNYIDSSGAGTLLAAHKAAVNAGVECNFFGASPGVITILRVVHLDKVLNLFPDEASALSNLLGKEPPPRPA
jgi:anti-sigma B factor antagonist